MKNLNFLFSAYLAVWAIFFLYHWSVARRLSRLASDLDRLKQTLK